MEKVWWKKKVHEERQHACHHTRATVTHGKIPRTRTCCCGVSLDRVGVRASLPGRVGGVTCKHKMDRKKRVKQGMDATTGNR